MASDLESYYSTIRSAQKGEDVRDAIDNAATAMKKASVNAGSLGGYKPEYFAVAQTYLEWYDQYITGKIGFDDISDLEDPDYCINSENLVNSDNLYAILTKYVKPSFSAISHYENDPNAGKEVYDAISSYLATFEKVKNDLKKAIVAKGVKVPKDYIFRTFADLILTIDDSYPDLVTGETFDENKEYDAGKNSTQAKAYEDIHVELDLDKYTVTGSGDENNKTYTPPAGKLFSSFDVKVKTRSGSYAASKEATSKRGKTADGEDILDENGLLKDALFEENNTTYTASDDGASGYSNFTVSIKEEDVGNQTFTVKFMNGADEVDSQEVIAYGTAYYNGEIPESELTDPDDSSKKFVCWVPSPTRVTSNMSCQAYYETPSEAIPGEIPDTWEEIVSNRGANYPIGSYKTLDLGTLDGVNYGQLIMEKVAIGESSSTSTWLSKTCFTSVSSTIRLSTNWANSGARTFLNNKFLYMLASYDEGKIIADAIVPVIKRTIVYASDRDSAITGEVITTDSIWVPSFGEMMDSELDAIKFKEGMPPGYTSLSYSELVNYYTSAYIGYAPGNNPPGESDFTNKRPYWFHTGNSQYLNSLAFEHFTNKRYYPVGELGRLPWYVKENPELGYLPFVGPYVQAPPDECSVEYVREELTAAQKNWFIKYNSTNTSTAVEYCLRTMGRFDYGKLVTVTSEGIFESFKVAGGDGNTYPIGFCL